MWSDWIHAVVEWFLSYGSWGLAILSFFESSFFPVIPDVILIPLGIAQPEWVWWYALITTLSSVAGALLGWWIGKKLGRPLMLRLFKHQTVEKVEAYFDQFGGFSLAIAGFTPIPFKVFTIASGMCDIRIREVVLWSLLGRGARFFLVAWIIAQLGQAAVIFIGQYFGPLSLSLVALILLIALIWHLLRRKGTTH